MSKNIKKNAMLLIELDEKMENIKDLRNALRISKHSIYGITLECRTSNALYHVCELQDKDLEKEYNKLKDQRTKALEELIKDCK